MRLSATLGCRSPSRARGREHDAIERVRFVQPPEIVVGVGEVGQRAGALAGVGARRRVEAHRLEQQRFGFRVGAGVREHAPERARGLRQRPVRSRQPARHFERALREALRVRPPRLFRAQNRERFEGADHALVVPPGKPLRARERVREQRVGAVQPAEALVGARQRALELGAHPRFGGELVRFAHAVIEQRDHAQRVRDAGLGVVALEQAGHEALDALRAHRFRARRVARVREPQRVERHHGDEHRERERRRADGRRVAAHELARAISERVAPRLERLARQEAVHLAQQRVHGRVAPRRVRVHGGQAQHVEIAPRRAARAAHRRLLAGRERRRPPRRLPGQDPGRLRRRSAPRSKGSRPASSS